MAQEAGELTTQAVETVLSRGDRDHAERLARRGETPEVVVLAQLDETERERVEEAAAEAGVPASAWLAQAVRQTAQDGGQQRERTTEELVQLAIMRHSSS